MSRLVLRGLLPAVVVAAFLGCGDDVRIMSATPDLTPPSTVTDLAATVGENSVIVLSWSAPADVGFLGKASTYDVRYSTSSIGEENWAAATQAQGEPGPGDPGGAERFAVPGLRPDSSYYFGLKALDRTGNLSDLSNVVLLDVTPPSTIVDLAAAGATPRTVTLTWTAPLENEPPGRAVSYDIRFSLEKIFEWNWDSATPALGPPSPGPAGSEESFVVAGLEPLTFYRIAVRSRDEKGNISDVSNVVEVTTTTIPQSW